MPTMMMYLKYQMFDVQYNLSNWSPDVSILHWIWCVASSIVLMYSRSQRLFICLFLSLVHLPSPPLGVGTLCQPASSPPKNLSSLFTRDLAAEGKNAANHYIYYHGWNLASIDENVVCKSRFGGTDHQLIVGCSMVSIWHVWRVQSSFLHSPSLQ
jgi:hypothetical protein